MIIGDRLKQLREERNMSQGDTEKRTGLLRCYISRVENGHTVPAVETLEKLARAYEVPMYQLFHHGTEKIVPPPKLSTTSSAVEGFGSKGKDAKYLNQMIRLLAKMSEDDRKLILYMAQKVSR